METDKELPKLTKPVLFIHNQLWSSELTRFCYDNKLTYALYGSDPEQIRKETDEQVPNGGYFVSRNDLDPGCCHRPSGMLQIVYKSDIVIGDRTYHTRKTVYWHKWTNQPMCKGLCYSSSNRADDMPKFVPVEHLMPDEPFAYVVAEEMERDEKMSDGEQLNDAERSRLIKRNE